MSDLIIKYGGESPFINMTNRMFAPLDTVHSIGECGIVGGWVDILYSIWSYVFFYRESIRGLWQTGCN